MLTNEELTRLYALHLQQGNLAEAEHELLWLQHHSLLRNHEPPLKRYISEIQPIGYLIDHGSLSEARQRIERISREAPGFLEDEQRAWHWQLPMAECVQSIWIDARLYAAGAAFDRQTLKLLSQLHDHLPADGVLTPKEQDRLREAVCSVKKANDALCKLAEVRGAELIRATETAQTHVDAAREAIYSLPRSQRLAESLILLLDRLRLTGFRESIQTALESEDFDEAKLLAGAAASWYPSQDDINIYVTRLASENVDAYRSHVAKARNAEQLAEFDQALQHAKAAFELFPESQRCAELLDQLSALLREQTERRDELRQLVGEYEREKKAGNRTRASDLANQISDVIQDIASRGLADQQTVDRLRQRYTMESGKGAWGKLAYLLLVAFTVSVILFVLFGILSRAMGSASAVTRPDVSYREARVTSPSAQPTMSGYARAVAVPSPSPARGPRQSTIVPSRALVTTQEPSSTPAPTTTATIKPRLVVPCEIENVCITFPRPDEILTGNVAIHGTATHPRFHFYKVEYGQGDKPEVWYTIDDVVYTQVRDGTLLELNTQGLRNGVYWLRLVVVDETGNFPPPHQVRVVIAN